MLQQTLQEQIFPDMPGSEKETWLENVVDEYPFFSLAHYFLLKEKGGLEAAPFHAAKTALHFSHPFLLQARLQDDQITMVENSPSIVTENLRDPVEENNEDMITTSPENVKNTNPVIAEVPGAAVAETSAPVKEEKLSELAFEPLHTTDYFASQGIKLSEEMMSQDKLGRQMKSFTAWLKTMKKIPGATDQVPVDVSVKAIAESSNREEEVYTETMAEVYISQQKYEKARDIYTKLSLLNPSKSAYFAAKLEKIKEY